MNTPSRCVAHRKNHDAVARDEIARLLRDAIHEAKEFGHVFAERNQIDFVVAVYQRAVGASSTAEFSGAPSARFGHRSEQKIGCASVCASCMASR